MRQVQAAVGGIGPLRARLEDIEVVAADATHDRRPDAADLVALAVGNRVQSAHNLADTLVRQAHVAGRAIAAGEGAPVAPRAVGQNRIDTGDVMNHVAVGDRA